MQRALRAFVLTAICAALGAGMARAQGSRKDDVVFNAAGRPMAGATVRICTADATGEPCAPLANPITTDGLGNYSFYAKPGRYTIEISGPGITTKTIPDVILPNDPSAPTFASLTTTSGISAFSLTLSGDLTVNGNTAVNGTLTVGTPGGSITATQLTPAGTSGDCAQWGTGGALADAGAPCGSGGGGGDSASANDAIQYGSKNSTAGTGLQISSPKAYLSSMFSALPSAGGEMDFYGAYGTGSGPITLDASCTTLKWLTTGDPNYTTPPSCMYDSKPFTLYGRGGTNAEATGWQAPATPINGCSTTDNTPCLQIEGPGHAFRGLKMQYNPISMEIGGTSDGSTGACPATSNTIIRDSNFSSYSASDANYGPPLKISCNSLWTSISHSVFQANPQATDNLHRAAILIDPHGFSSGSFSALNVFDHIETTGGGGIFMRGGTGGTSSLYVNHIGLEGTTRCQAPVSLDPHYYGYIGSVVVNDVSLSDCGTKPPAFAGWHWPYPEIFQVSNSQGIVEGSATIRGMAADYTAGILISNFGVPVARVYPSAKNDKGQWLGHVLNDVSDVWRSGTPQIVRFAQSSNMDWNSADWNLTDMGTGVAVSAITDPWQGSGKGDAWALSCTADGTTGCWARVANVSISYSAGDYVLLSALVKPGSSAGIVNTGRGQIAIMPNATGPYFRFIASGGGGQVSSGGLMTRARQQTDGHWQRVWVVGQATKSGSVGMKLTLAFDASHPLDIAAPMMLRIPAADVPPIDSPCTISAASESGTTLSFTTTAACPVSLGEPFIISGSSTSGWNSADVQDAFTGANNTDATSGLYVVTAVTDSTHFSSYSPSTGLSAASDGTVTFTNDSEAAELARTLDFYPPSCTVGERCNAWGTAPDLGADQTWAGTNTITGSVTPSGSGAVTATKVTPAGTMGNCVEWGSGGALADAGAACGTSGMVYPGAGIAVSTGSAWGTSLTAPTGTIVGTTDTQALTNKTLDGVTPTTMSYLDATSSIQTQLDGKVGAASNAGAAKQVWVSGGADKTATAIDFPDIKQIPAAECNNATAGAAWSLPTSGAPTPACRTGTNVQAGVLQFAASDSAQFQIDIPGDWDSSGTVYAKIHLTQGSNTTASQTIIMQIATGCGTTDDPSFNTTQSFGTATTGTTANTVYNETVNGVTMTGCSAGDNMNVKISRTGSDTATTDPNIYWVTLTFPRLLTNQAN